MLELKNIKMVFDSRGIAGIHGIDLSLKPGEVISILGPNGSGKTTLLRIIHREIQASGDLSLDGQTHFFKMTEPLDDVSVQDFLISKINDFSDDEKKTQLARDLADLFEFTSQFRHKIHQLSAGQRQKILVAAELIQRPKILLMDEPFSHMDPISRDEILRSLFKYIRRHNMSVLWVTHDREEAFKYSDRIGIMNFGKWEQIGVPADIIRLPRTLFAAQFLGYKNFLSVKYDQGWITPWGILDLPAGEKSEAILVMPESWSETSDGPEFLVLRTYPSASGIFCDFEGLDRIFTALFPIDQLPDFKKPLTLTPNLRRSFLIAW